MGSLKSKMKMSEAKSRPMTGQQKIKRAQEASATNRANMRSFLDQGYGLYDSMQMGMKKSFYDKRDAYRARVGGASKTGYQQPGMQGSALAKIVKANKAKAKRHLK